jgi:hypothetical protein
MTNDVELKDLGPEMLLLGELSLLDKLSQSG